MKMWVIYFAIKIPLTIDMVMAGPITQMVSAATGLPIR